MILFKSSSSKENGIWLLSHIFGDKLIPIYHDKILLIFSSKHFEILFYRILWKYKMWKFLVIFNKQLNHAYTEKLARFYI